jgi:hypothetical protein
MPLPSPQVRPPPSSPPDSFSQFGRHAGLRDLSAGPSRLRFPPNTQLRPNHWDSLPVPLLGRSCRRF